MGLLHQSAKVKVPALKGLTLGCLRVADWKQENKHVNKENFFKQAVANFIKEKLYMIYFSPVCSGMLLIISESPGSMTASVHALWYFPHAVPNSILLPLE